MKFLMTALLIACLGSSAWAAEPQWNWIEVQSTGQGLRTDQGQAEVKVEKRSIRITFFFQGGAGVFHVFRGTLGPPRDRPRFKTVVGFDASGVFTTEGTDYNEKTPMRGTYVKDSYSGKDRSQMNLSCIETIVLSDGYNTVTVNRVVDGHHDC
jgi:opacity protein-like surface antigen